jgi:hypothetical protein
VVKGPRLSFEAKQSVNFMGLIKWKPIPAVDARRHWQEHEEIAVRVHAGASHYERNVVEECYGISLGQFDGMTDFGFASVDDLQHRFWSSKQGADEVLTDVADFVESSHRVYFSPEKLFSRS